ncbi:expansin-like family protein [Tripterygium wilfordii]|uniref:Expansin-like family protein n=1 Tax=Tripterygium wilfordii TaxID=458696 RepID=A0A7J7CR98_TRIWF|nr:expansin-like A3 [Tripterygium wilfordii]KAF5736633.1 expansin-like family protein [Tripterygium wilfordii]
MGSSVCFIFLLFSYANALKLCDRCFNHAGVGHTNFPPGQEYADFTCYLSDSEASQLSGGHIAAVSDSFYERGVVCGKCYQIRCTDKDLCNSKRIKVTVTRLSRNPNKGEFILNKEAFNDLAKKGKERQLSKLSKVISEYKSIPCVYQNHNLTLRLTGYQSDDNGWIMVRTLFQGGQTEIKDIVIFGDNASDKVHMRWVDGGQWQALRVPAGNLTFALTVENNLTWVTHYWKSHMRPQDMVAGYYDTGILITEIQPELCEKCDN